MKRPSRRRRSGANASGGLDAPVAGLPGAGPVTAARLAEAGIRTVRDLLTRLPRGYDDLRSETPWAELAERPDGAVVLVRGTVRRVHLFPRRLLDVVIGERDDAAAPTVRARWFRPFSAMAKSFVKGAEITLAGPLRTGKDNLRELVHPSVVTKAIAAGGAVGLGIRPRYAPVEGVPGRLFEQLVAAALAELDDTGGAGLLPPSAEERLGLPPLMEALRNVHAPIDVEPTEPALAVARRRIAVEELFVAQVAFCLRSAEAGVPTVRVAPHRAAAATSAAESALAVTFTPSQRRALAEIAADLASGRAMQRLLLGDVGSGKTAVAFAAAAMVAAGGGHTLMMVPTEALAAQQAAVLAGPGERLGLAVEAITGGTTAAERSAFLDRAATGQPVLLVGTQALLALVESVPRLGLAVVDEQHRFGVAQRARLGRSKEAGAPHLLAMSATPIPRSLALTVAGDLDSSILIERPSGRPPPEAVLCLDAEARGAAYGRVRAEVAVGRQAFVVCAVRETARRPGAVTAVAHHRRLQAALAPARVGLVHGELPADDKAAVLRAFAAGAWDVLVATTVVELGIDVPNATVMIIEDADRFGIAQLHQLRGRVGRGTGAGVCLLCADGETIGADGRARLEALTRERDGFRLAELDLAQRGFGDLLGTRQAGGPVGASAFAEWSEAVESARDEAARLLAGDPELARAEHAGLAVVARERARTMFAGEAG